MFFFHTLLILKGKTKKGNYFKTLHIHVLTPLLPRQLPLPRRFVSLIYFYIFFYIHHFLLSLHTNQIRGLRALSMCLYANKPDLRPNIGNSGDEGG